MDNGASVVLQVAAKASSMKWQGVLKGRDGMWAEESRSRHELEMSNQPQEI